MGLWADSVRDQYHPFVVPQEHGHHIDARWFELLDAAGRGIRITGEPTVGFSARLHGDAVLTRATTRAELSPGETVEVHIDLAMRGLGTAACGPDTADQHKVRSGNHRFAYWITPV